MADTTPTRSYKPIWWALVVVAFVALCAWTYVGSKRSNRELQQASTTPAGQEPAYDSTTGRTVPSGAQPGALGTGGPPPAPGTSDTVNGSAGGTNAGVNPQAHEVPGGYARGTATPPAQLNR